MPLPMMQLTTSAAIAQRPIERTKPTRAPKEVARSIASGSGLTSESAVGSGSVSDHPVNPELASKSPHCLRLIMVAAQGIVAA
jgi:hypothetical protein